MKMEDNRGISWFCLFCGLVLFTVTLSIIGAMILEISADASVAAEALIILVPVILFSLAFSLVYFLFGSNVIRRNRLIEKAALFGIIPFIVVQFGILVELFPDSEFLKSIYKLTVPKETAALLPVFVLIIIAIISIVYFIRGVVKIYNSEEKTEF